MAPNRLNQPNGTATIIEQQLPDICLPPYVGQGNKTQNKTIYYLKQKKVEKISEFREYD